MAAPMWPVESPGLTVPPAHQRLVGDLDQPLGAARDVAHGVHAAGVAVPTVDDERHVDVDDIAFFEGLGVGNAVADHMVD
jgi:hypothetical protein